MVTKNIMSCTPIFLVALLMTVSSCHHLHPIRAPQQREQATELTKREVSLEFVPEKDNIPAHILYRKNDHFGHNQSYQNKPFIIDFVISPLMRNPNIIARVEKNGKLQRQFSAKKTAVNVLSDKKNTWSPIRSKLFLAIPFLSEGEEVVVTTSYEWMDIRWLPPVFLEEEGMITKDAFLAVDVPFGVSTRFKSAKDGVNYDLVPTNTPIEKKSLLITKDNQSGSGMRYLWRPIDLQRPYSLPMASLLFQVFVAFDNPAKSDNRLKFDSWEAVSRYIYDRMDRYDQPSEEIRKFAVKETRDFFEVDQKIKRLLSFLGHDIENRPVSGSYYEQDVQPATKTFDLRSGSRLDKVILAKALFGSIGLKADLIVVADKRKNPNISDIYTPALFSSVMLALEVDGKLYYLEPDAAFDMNSQLDPNFQGQQALMVRPKSGLVVALPFAVANNNVRNESYHLWLTPDGFLEGECAADFLGFESMSKTRALAVQKTMSTQEIESAFLTKNKLPFALQSARVSPDETNTQNISLVGYIKPSMLGKTKDGAFLLDLGTILMPVIEAMKNAQEKGYSAITKMSVSLSMPKNVIIKNLPAPLNIHANGISSRFFSYFSDGQLVIEGMTMVSMPLPSTTPQSLKNLVEKVHSFVEKPIIIADSSVSKEETRGDTQPKNLEEAP